MFGVMGDDKDGVNYLLVLVIMLFIYIKKGYFRIYIINFIFILFFD